MGNSATSEPATANCTSQDVSEIKECGTETECISFEDQYDFMPSILEIDSDKNNVKIHQGTMEPPKPESQSGVGSITMIPSKPTSADKFEKADLLCLDPEKRPNRRSKPNSNEEFLSVKSVASADVSEHNTSDKKPHRKPYKLPETNSITEHRTAESGQVTSTKPTTKLDTGSLFEVVGKQRDRKSVDQLVRTQRPHTERSQPELDTGSLFEIVGKQRDRRSFDQLLRGQRPHTERSQRLQNVKSEPERIGLPEGDSFTEVFSTRKHKETLRRDSIPQPRDTSEKVLQTVFSLKKEERDKQYRELRCNTELFFARRPKDQEKPGQLSKLKPTPQLTPYLPLSCAEKSYTKKLSKPATKIVFKSDLEAGKSDEKTTCKIRPPEHYRTKSELTPVVNPWPAKELVLRRPEKELDIDRPTLKVFPRFTSNNTASISEKVLSENAAYEPLKVGKEHSKYREIRKVDSSAIKFTTSSQKPVKTAEDVYSAKTSSSNTAVERMALNLEELSEKPSETHLLKLTAKRMSTQKSPTQLGGKAKETSAAFNRNNNLALEDSSSESPDQSLSNSLNQIGVGDVKVVAPSAPTIDDTKKKDEISKNDSSNVLKDKPSSSSVQPDAQEQPAPMRQLAAVKSKLEDLKERVDGFQGDTCSKQFEHLKVKLLCCEAELDDIDSGDLEVVRTQRKQLRKEIREAIRTLETSDAIE